MTDYKFFEKAQAGKDLPTTSGGASSYFSSPSDSLDPNLFDGEHLKPEVRSHILRTLVGWFGYQGYSLNQNWLHVWLAGSGITYQWAASRGNGDLDAFFAVDLTLFEEANPERFRGVNEHDLAAWLNEDLRSTLWPLEASVLFGSQVYEVTYFCVQGNYA